MNYKAIIFDFEYTLGDPTTEIVLNVNYALEQLGIPSKEKEKIKKRLE